MKSVITTILFSSLLFITSCAHYHGCKKCCESSCDMSKEQCQMKKEQCNMKSDKAEPKAPETAPAKK